MNFSLPSTGHQLLFRNIILIVISFQLVIDRIIFPLIFIAIAFRIHWHVGQLSTFLVHFKLKGGVFTILLATVLLR